MKKKNLIILLLIPFLIALLGVVTINTTFHFIDNDIIRIDWDYSEQEAFEVRESLYQLKATGISEKNYPAGPGNNLVWSIRNKDENDQNEYARIVEQNGVFYLETLLPGEVIITCANEKGNIFKYMNAIIYEGGYILIKPKLSGSQNNIDQNIYYGEYDLQNGNKVQATFEFTIETNRENVIDSLIVKEQSPYLEVDLKNKKVIIKKGAKGTQSFTIGCTSDDIAKPYTYMLHIVENGVNVYTYDDLLNCTNRSDNGEIVVLRKSFESLDNYYSQMNSGNVELFGTYDEKSKKFHFENEVYTFETTSCKDYINKWNAYAKSSDGKYKEISSQTIVGIRVQKDFYGNGFTINMHNLTYPTAIIETTSSDGSIVNVPTLSDRDLFRGPIPIYTLGDHNQMPLIEALGQDNIGMYVDGSNITINDINMKNCDFGNMLSNLSYTGTVVETNGNNITIKNSRIANGKHVLRSYSSMNTKVINCMLSNARNFLISVGANEFIPIDDAAAKEFINLDGTTTSTTIGEYLTIGSIGDTTLNAFLTGEFSDKIAMKSALLNIQNALNNPDLIKDNYKGTIEIIDTLFYRSGIASISIDSMFNGPFLYGGVPSMINGLLTMLVPFVPDHIGGLAYPVKVDIIGSTKFYDYKTKDQMDISGLINENVSTFAQEAGDIFGVEYNGEITIDSIFPLKSYLFNKAPKYTTEDGTYVNVPIAFYGGAINLSTVNVDTLDIKAKLTSQIDVDLLDQYLNLPSGDTLVLVKNAMLKSVTIVTGYEPFQFICMDSSGYLFNETPKVSELIENAKNI